MMIILDIYIFSVIHKYRHAEIEVKRFLRIFLLDFVLRRCNFRRMNDNLTYTYISVEIERDKRDFFRWYAKKHHMSMRGFLGKVVSDLYEQYFEQYAQAMEERQRQNDLNDLMYR